MNSINKIHGTVIHDARITEDMVAQLETSSITELELWPSEDETKDGWELSDIQKKALQVPGKSMTLILHATPKSYEEELVNAGGVIPEETERTIKGTIEIKDSNFGVADGDDWYWLNNTDNILTLTQIEIKNETPDVQLLEIYVRTLSWNEAYLPTTPGDTTYFDQHSTINFIPLCLDGVFSIKALYKNVLYKNMSDLTAALNADGFGATDIDFSKMVCSSGRLQMDSNGSASVFAFVNGIVAGYGLAGYNYITWAINSVLSDDGSGVDGHIVTCLAAEETSK